MSELREDVPTPLARRMEELLTTVTGAASDTVDPAATPVADASSVTLANASADDLGAAGLEALRRALAGVDTGAIAADLLAADALITGACADAATNGIPNALAPESFVAFLEEL